MKRLLMGLAVLAMCSVPVWADTLVPGEVLLAVFDVPTSPECGSGACDTLLFTQPISGTTGSVAETIQLYNGSMFLGTFTSNGAEAGIS